MKLFFMLFLMPVTEKQMPHGSCSSLLLLMTSDLTIIIVGRVRVLRTSTLQPLFEFPLVTRWSNIHLTMVEKLNWKGTQYFLSQSLSSIQILPYIWLKSLGIDDFFLKSSVENSQKKFQVNGSNICKIRWNQNLSHVLLLSESGLVSRTNVVNKDENATQR